jgi:hypothetical protein
MYVLIVRFNNMFANGKAQSCAANIPASVSIYAIKSFKYPV